MHVIKWISSIVLIKDEIYCIPGGTNILYRINLEEGVASRQISLGRKNSSFWSVVMSGGSIYCIPSYGGKIYKINSKDYGVINELDYGFNEEIIEAKEIEGKIWIIPRRLSTNVKVVDTESDRIDNIKLNAGEYERLCRGNIIRRWFFADFFAYFITDNGKVISVDFIERVMEEVTLPHNMNCRDFIVSDNEYLYLSEEKPCSIYFLDDKKKYNGKMCESKYKIHKLISWKGKVYADMEDGLGTIEEDGSLIKQVEYCHGESKSEYIKVIDWNGQNVFLPWGSDKFIIHNRNDEWNHRAINLPIRDVLYRKEIWDESELTLTEFIEGIVETQ